jgi:hypothetical protein
MERGGGGVHERRGREIRECEMFTCCPSTTWQIATTNHVFMAFEMLKKCCKNNLVL